MFPNHEVSVNAIRIMTLAMGAAVSKVFLDFVIATKVNRCNNFWHFFTMDNEVVVIVLATIASILTTQVLPVILSEDNQGRATLQEEV